MNPFRKTCAAAALALAALVPAASKASGVLVLNEGFGNVGALSGWTQANLSDPAGNGWFQGNPEIFPAAGSAAGSYIAANFLGAANGSGNVDEWLVTPQLTLSDITRLSFYTRDSNEAGSDFLQVLFLSGTGADATARTLLTVGGDAAYPTDWLLYSVEANLPGTGRFAFRYLGNADELTYIGLDSVRVVTAVPEPSGYLMLGLGLGFLPLLRRRASA